MPMPRFNKRPRRKMTYHELLKRLENETHIEVREELTAGERRAVREGHVVMRVYHDQPADVPYPFRYKKYYLIRSDDFIGGKV